MSRFNTGATLQTFVKALVYGVSGAGKTKLTATAPDLSRAFIFSVEAGTLSLADYSISGWNINTMAEATEAYTWLTQSEEAEQYDFITVDSITELGSLCLEEEMPKVTDKRQAYQALNSRMKKLIRAFRDIPNKHVLITAQQSKLQDDNGRFHYGPELPGSKLAAGIPYWFDLVLAYRLTEVTDPESGVISIRRDLQTIGDENYLAKDRSGKLNLYEPPNMATILEKVTSKEE